MAKEIGNWGKPKAARPRRTKLALHRATAIEALAYRVDVDETILWASYGSGHRWDIRSIFVVGMSALGGVLLYQMLTAILAALPIGPQIETLALGFLAAPFYAAYRFYRGPRLEVYGITDRRVVILQRHIPFLLTTCEVLRLRVDEPVAPSNRGSVLFGRDDPEMTESRPSLMQTWKYSSPEPGFYGIENPLEVARLINTHVEPDVFPDTYAGTFENLPLWR